jgi:hypothetical protein
VALSADGYAFDQILAAGHVSGANSFLALTRRNRLLGVAVLGKSLRDARNQG